MIIEVLGFAGFVFFLSYWMTGRLCSPASGLYFLDRPNERSLHVAPTPRTGGLAILGSLAVGLLLGFAADNLIFQELPAARFSTLSPWVGLCGKASLWIVGLALAVGAVSFWDDRVGVSSSVRFAMQAVAGAGVVWGAGLKVDELTFPLLGKLPLGWLAVPLTILFIMWMTNLYNFMDGMDGFAGGMTVMGFGFLSYLAWMGEHYSIAMLSFLIAGAAGGLLFYNLPPARIFMGDVGSVPLGFMAGAVSVMGIQHGLFDAWVPLLIFSPFIVDATVTLFRRFLRREKVWQAHRQHYYQRLVLAGWGHRKTVLAEYVLMLACGLSALLYLEVNEQLRFVLLLGWAAVYSFLLYCVHGLEKRLAEQRKCGS